MDRASIALVLSTSSLLIVSGCGGSASVTSGTTTTASAGNTSNTNAGRTSAYVSSDPQVQAGPAYGMQRAGEGPAVAQRGVGMDAEHPVPACGPQDSYDYVATRFRCPDGTNPLGGDPRAGQMSRLGNVGANSTGHIIDVYRVPCASGPIDVYVDMYGCPEMAGMLGQ
ncbi:MAG: hypothetical protein J0L92_33360 [Deltaproteobacteria bacterium]|nr:hypothetical protein [Deltaproteobacteria bacterium]